MKIDTGGPNYSESLLGIQNKAKTGGSDFDAVLRRTSIGMGPTNTVSLPEGGQGSESEGGLTPKISSRSSNAALHEEFSKWARMSPTERLRAQYLERHGMTEQSLCALPEDVRKEIEDAIKDDIKMQLDAEARKKNNGINGMPGPTF
ncbi:hypothetical protein J2X72_001380 [Phyllobacterium sp. 1468]|uniref:hypothetical protein n=1 Tax=Phyllobacterium sp. 1468 TaxID=2817759 RepID=UPI00285ED99B|nr:hypothetical protein [Phyllobacterium sp. 1468]MDR6632596.1 hypothetical protein [Phyllobacterium sp. 1468]